MSIKCLGLVAADDEALHHSALLPLRLEGLVVLGRLRERRDLAGEQAAAGDVPVLDADARDHVVASTMPTPLLAERAAAWALIAPHTVRRVGDAMFLYLGGWGPLGRRRGSQRLRLLPCLDPLVAVLAR